MPSSVVLEPNQAKGHENHAQHADYQNVAESASHDDH
jgi:hypothetical protein